MKALAYFVIALLLETVASFLPSLVHSKSSTHGCTCQKAKNKDNFFDDDLFQDDSEVNPKLGIDIGKMLKPLTPEEAEALRVEASELISDKIAQGIDDIEALRGQLQMDLEKQQQERMEKSERDAQQASKQLLNKIDKLTEGFLSTTKETRESTKRAAAADAAMKGKGIELGSWGTLGGASVGLLGSVASVGEFMEEESPTENRILILADPSQDPLAKTLIPAFSELLEKAIAGVDVQVLKPTQTMPLGGDNAACVICFATSLSDSSSLKNMLDRLLRRTMTGGGKLTRPPTQLVCVSTLGTERTNKVPYSMQNLLGGKLDKRRQIEEAVINTIRKRAIEPPLDYTIIKVGELKESKNGFSLLPGDTLDGTTSPNLAAHVLVEAVAFQPFARNATLCVTGTIPENVSPQVWDEAFLRLDGPELVRFEGGLSDPLKHDQLNEYLGEWALMMESGKKALATPIRVEPSKRQFNLSREGVKERAGVRLLFLPTKTGSAYMSRSEEKSREQETGTSSSSGSAPRIRKTKPEGGVEVLVEVTTEDSLRVRARRCNMADDTVIKEISEETILKRLEDSLDAWKKGSIAW